MVVAVQGGASAVSAHAWSPPWAPHVEGSYDDREPDEDGIPQEARVEARCRTCGATFRRMCASGLMRNWIATFARAHIHRDPLNDAPPSLK